MMRIFVGLPLLAIAYALSLVSVPAARHLRLVAHNVAGKAPRELVKPPRHCHRRPPASVRRRLQVHG